MCAHVLGPSGSFEIVSPERVVSTESQTRWIVPEGTPFICATLGTVVGLIKGVAALEGEC
jgi:hypothetical protein